MIRDVSHERRVTRGRHPEREIPRLAKSLLRAINVGQNPRACSDCDSPRHRLTSPELEGWTIAAPDLNRRRGFGHGSGLGRFLWSPRRGAACDRNGDVSIVRRRDAALSHRDDTDHERTQLAHDSRVAEAIATPPRHELSLLWQLNWHPHASARLPCHQATRRRTASPARERHRGNAPAFDRVSADPTTEPEMGSSNLRTR